MRLLMIQMLRQKSISILLFQLLFQSAIAKSEVIFGNPIWGGRIFKGQPADDQPDDIELYREESEELRRHFARRNEAPCVGGPTGVFFRGLWNNTAQMGGGLSLA